MSETIRQKRREEYLRKLRDPRWQRKRLEIMQRDQFTCQLCDATEETLNVHHNYYTQGAEPWEYPETALVTLCETCHSEETENRRSEEALLLDVCRKLGLHASGLNGIAIALHGLGDYSHFGEHWEYELTWMIRNFWELREVMDPLRAEAFRKLQAALKREGEENPTGAVQVTE